MNTPQKSSKSTVFFEGANAATPLKLPNSPFLKNLGYGTGVNVYKLDRSPKFGVCMSPWAIKKVSINAQLTNKNEVITKRLNEEAEILRKLTHPNIVGFRGLKTTIDGKKCLAMESCDASLGDILEERFETKQGPLPANLILKICVDILNALEYLHNTARILHGDIKSHNILVKGDFEICKLCDFGVSLKLDENMTIDSNSAYVGTDIWAAPEVINDEVITDKADIFSFGLTIYETIALIPPHTWSFNRDITKTGTSSASDTSINELDTTISNYLGTRPPLPDVFELSEEYNKAVEVYYVCTQSEPEDRPSASNLVKALKNA